MPAEEHSSHGIEEILVILQILLVLDQMQLELLTDTLVEQGLVMLDIVNQLSEEIVRFN